MKFLCLIFSVYFFALAITPCEDKDTCPEGNKKTALGLQTENTQDHQDQKETCNPLCICSCCGGITLVAENTLKVIPPVSPGHPGIYAQAEVSEISFSIWQPPRIG